MRRSIIFVLALGAAAAATPATAQSLLPSQEQYTVRVEYRRWHANLEALFREGETGTLIDPVADLGMPEDERTREIHATLQLAAGHKLRASQIRIDYAGDTVISKEILYSGTRYEVNERIASSVKGYYWAAGYEIDFVKRQAGYLGLVIGARLLDTDIVLVAPDRGVQEAVSSKTVAPVLGLAGRQYADSLSFGGEVSGLYLGDRGYLLDADASARFHFSDQLAVQLGYRYIKARGELDSTAFGETRISGLTYGVEVSF